MGVIKSLLKCFHFIFYVVFVFFLLNVFLPELFSIRPTIAMPLSLIFAIVSGVAFNYEMIIGAFKGKTGRFIVNICVILTVVLLGSVLIFHFAISPSIPFDYMSNLDVSQEYENLDTPQKKLVYTIPENIAKRLKTEPLLDTILANEWLVDLNAYDNYVDAVKSREIQFRIVEFLGREDAVEVLDKKILEYNEKLSQKEQEMGYTVDEMVMTPNLFEGTEEQYEFLHLSSDINFMERIKKLRSEILS